MKYKIKIYFWRIANKRYLKHKTSAIDAILLYIVNYLNK